MQLSWDLAQQLSALFPWQSRASQAQPLRLGCEMAGAIIRLRTANAASSPVIFMASPPSHHSCEFIIYKAIVDCDPTSELTGRKSIRATQLLAIISG
jgi:hypothetical protein